MSINLSEGVSNAMLNVLATMMDGGQIHLLSSGGIVLAVLQLSDPAANGAVGGGIKLNKIADEDAALARGQAASARIVAADGNEIFSCDVGEENSDAVIKLNTTSIYRGSPVRLSSFILAMP